MPSTEYELDKDLDAAIKRVVENPEYSEFNELRDLAIVICGCVSVRMNSDGEAKPCEGDPVKLRKLSPVDRLFMTKKPHFVLIIDFHEWSNANTMQQEVMVYRGLVRILAEKTDDGLKVGTRKPDIVEYTSTIVRFGAFSETLADLKAAFKSSAHRVIPKMVEQEEGEEWNGDTEEGEDTEQPDEQAVDS